MKDEDLPRYAVVACVVVAHRHYGPNTRTVAGGKPGCIDDSAVSDDPANNRGNWPAVGQQLARVVLGTTRDGRLRLSARSRDVELARSVADVRAALELWRAVGDKAADVGDVLQAAEAVPVLSWALRHPVGSAERTGAEAVVDHALEELVRALFQNPERAGDGGSRTPQRVRTESPQSRSVDSGLPDHRAIGRSRAAEADG